MLQYQEQAGPVFRALADDNRRAILARLSEGPATVSELAEPLTISLAATVQHVQSLERVGLLTSDKEGRSRTCRLKPEGLVPIEQWISENKALWERRLDRFSDALDRAAAKNVEGDSS